MRPCQACSIPCCWSTAVISCDMFELRLLCFEVPKVAHETARRKIGYSEGRGNRALSVLCEAYTNSEGTRIPSCTPSRYTQVIPVLLTTK